MSRREGRPRITEEEDILDDRLKRLPGAICAIMQLSFRRGNGRSLRNGNRSCKFS